MKIQNIVCTGSFNQVIDLESLSIKCFYVNFGQNNYPAAYFKKDSKSVTLYRNGKYIMQGMKSLEEVDVLFSVLKDELSSFLDVSLCSYPTICNLVCSSSFKNPVNLVNLFLTLQGLNCDVVYEPESFPGLILKEDQCTYNIFSSGKFVILGCKTIDSALNAESSLLSRNIA